MATLVLKSPGEEGKKKKLFDDRVWKNAIE